MDYRTIPRILIFKERYHATICISIYIISPSPSDDVFLVPPGCRPLPIPTLDEFVLLHKGLAAAVAVDPGALDALHGARRSFGWNLLGNLLDLGLIAFAPATPQVLRCCPKPQFGSPNPDGRT